MDFIAPAIHRDIAYAGSHERSHLAVAFAVLGQNFVGREDVSRRSGEVAVPEKCGFRNDFFRDGHQYIGIKNI